MKKHLLVICEDEGEYVKRLSQQLKKKGEGIFQVQGFSSLKNFLDFKREHKIDILLTSETFLGEEVKKEEVEHVMYLSEGSLIENKNGKQFLYKYQSSEKTFQKVLKQYGEIQGQLKNFEFIKEQTKLIGVYSPIGRCGKTKFAIALGQELAKEKKTLYLNLEEHSGWGDREEEENSPTLGDIIYFLKQKERGFPYELEGSIRKLENLDYLSPFKLSLDGTYIEVEEWEKLFGKLGKESKYEVIILDLGSGIKGLFELLNMCTKVYTPFLGDETSANKMKQYKETLELLEMETVLEKTEEFYGVEEKRLTEFVKSMVEDWKD